EPPGHAGHERADRCAGPGGALPAPRRGDRDGAGRRRGPAPRRGRGRLQAAAVATAKPRCVTALRISWVDVFTDRPFAGNRLAVVLDADPLDAAGMQTLAAELNLPETTFVLDGVSRLRIFTPTTELPLAGHPVVGTTVELGRLGLLGDGDHVFRMGAGDTPVALHDGLATMTQPDLRVHRELDPALSASLLGLDPGDVTGRPVVCETAVPQGFAQVVDRDAL